MCAERVAIFSAVASGYRTFSRIVVVADTDEPISPCGACRQVISEFHIGEIILCNRLSQVIFTLEQLLPRATTGILNH
jgi:cytidine deaminase